ncbi:MAG: hypothetical protein C0501_08095 [Isosphaera sp.]|nr:hypothetical protein [Isosphaera sp.]
MYPPTRRRQEEKTAEPEDINARGVVTVSMDARVDQVRAGSGILTASPGGGRPMPFDPDARLAGWRKSLLDTSKRNRLIRFAVGRGGGLHLLHPTAAELWASLVRDGAALTFPRKRDLLGLPPEVPDPDTLASDAEDIPDLDRELTDLCRRSPHLRPDHLLTDVGDRPLAARLARLALTAREAETDHGVTTLFAAFGFLRWSESADDEESLAPLLLVPVRLGRETVESPFTLRAEDDDILPNHSLAELLASQFRVRLPAAADCPLDPDDPECLTRYLAAVRERVGPFPRWAVTDAAAVGVFHFQKLAMWEDLGRNAARVTAHPLVRAVAGDTAVSLAAPAGLPAAADLDREVVPAAAVHILDADSSQHEAIEAVARGAHLVMDGPPGTGKSQTIANMIAGALAAGKTVLFVSEKTAALEVVKRRLDARGVGVFCLELHSHKARKKEVVEQLRESLELKPEGVPDAAAALSELAHVRARLNGYVAELHAARPPLGWSAFRVHGELARLVGVPGRSRLDIPDVHAKDAEYLRRGTEILAGLADCRSVIEEPGGHPWRGCKVTAYSHAAADEARFHLTRLAAAVPAAEAAGRALAATGVVAGALTARTWPLAEANARAVVDAPLFPPEWFADDPRRAATGAVERHRLLAEIADLTAKLPEFDAAAVERFDATAPDRERLRTTPPTACDRLAALGRADAALRELVTATGNLAMSAAGLGRLLGIGVPATDQCPKVAAAAGWFGRPGPVPGSWWNPGRRAELSAAATRARDDETAAQAGRIDLVKRWSPAALAPEATRLVRDAAHAGRSFLTRLLPRWRSLRQQVAAWHVGQLPAGAAFRTELAALAEYHRKADAVRQVAAAYSGEWFDVGGAVDWTATVEGLNAAGVLAAAGARDGSFDRTAVAAAAADLTRADAAFRDRWAAAAREVVLPSEVGVRPADLAARLEEERAAVGRESAALGVLVSLLKPGADVPAANIRERGETLSKLAAARRRLSACRVPSRSAEQTDDAPAAGGASSVCSADLDGTRQGPPLDEPTARAHADLAAQLLPLLDRMPVSPALAATLSESAARDRLRTALAASHTARPDFEKAWGRVTADLFDPDAPASTNLVLRDTPLSDLAAWATARAADADRLAEWARFAQVKADATAFGLAPILDEVSAGEFPPAAAADAFRARFLRLWLDAVHQESPVLAGFATESHERLIARFAQLDRLSITATPQRVRGRLLADPIRPRVRDDAPDGSELGILQREVNKKRRHLPLRDLFRQIPTVLRRLKPCLMTSPLAVSTYLDAPDLIFDLVIFDEASQVRPHDAVCAIYRGRQLVVGGDPKQLPPTDFFARAAGDDEEEPAGTAGFESLLDVCLALGLPRARLRWHYRSRREGLIAFSNRHFYDGRLVTFPSADEATARAVTFVRVADGRFLDGVNPVEAGRVADLVMEHARTQSDRSLGVIAFSQRQQDRILAEIEVRRRESPDTEGFFDDGRPDPFFVKNLENVQGDERDVILLGVGYGPDESGTVAMRFGPLNRAGGERRLNVAVTRARWAMTVVSSMTAADIDLSRTGSEGAKLLKAFLDYAERGPVALAESGGEPARGGSPFEDEVGDELARRGLTVHRRVGCGGYRIDLAVSDPGQGGRYLLGVECDGETYRSAATARDRDRLRREVLEGLGWRLVRVWSADWARDRERQVGRVLAALDAAKRPPIPVAPDLPLTLLPAAKRKPDAEGPEYAAIDDVPAAAVAEAVTGALAAFGSMPADELIAAVARRLGFKRTGARIRERVAEAMNVLAAAGRLAVADDGRVQGMSP